MVARTLYLILIMCYCCSTTACKKKKSTLPIDELPPITQNGENTFGCLVNGEPAFTELHKSLFSQEGIDFSDGIANYESLIIYAKTKNNNTRRDFRFSLEVSDPVQLTTYSANLQLNDFRELGSSVSIYPVGSNTGNQIYSSDSLIQAEVTITKYVKSSNHPSGSALAGTFNMILVNQTTLDTVKLTSGRFDIQVP